MTMATVINPHQSARCSTSGRAMPVPQQTHCSTARRAAISQEVTSISSTRKSMKPESAVHSAHRSRHTRHEVTESIAIGMGCRNAICRLVAIAAKAWYGIERRKWGEMRF